MQSCGTAGGELYAGSDSPGSAAGPNLACGNGSKTLCNTTQIRTCTSWRITTVGGEADVKDLSGVELKGEFKLTCETWTTTTLEFRWV